MELLKELVKFVSPQSLRKVEIFSNSPTSPSKLQRLFRSISANPKGLEEEIALEAMQADPSSASYRQIKSKLTKRLINNLFLIDPNEAQFNNYSRAYLNGRKTDFSLQIYFIQWVVENQRSS